MHHQKKFSSYHRATATLSKSSQLENRAAVQRYFANKILLKTNFYFRGCRVVNFNRQDVLAVVSKPMRFIAFF